MTESDFNVLLTEQVMDSLDIPFVSEERERAAVHWIISKVAHLIPESIRTFCLDAADGLDNAELSRLEDVLVNVISEYTDAPAVPTIIERVVIRMVVKACLEYAKMGYSLT